MELNIGWLDSTATYMSDPLHPNLSGYEKMAAYDLNATGSPAPGYVLGGIFLIFLRPVGQSSTGLPVGE